jgi:hypothetical protein
MTQAFQNRRTALQLAAQLPPEPKDALAVLHLTQEIVEKFFGPPRRDSEGTVSKLRTIEPRP